MTETSRNEGREKNWNSRNLKVFRAPPATQLSFQAKKAPEH